MKKRLSCAGILAALVISSWSSSSQAADAHGMAEKGQLFISADRLVPLFGYTNGTLTTDGPGGQEVKTSTSATGISLLTSADMTVDNPHTVPRPAFDLTVIPHLTLGLAVPIAFGLGGSNTTKSGNTERSTDAATSTLFGIVPRVGYILPLNDFLAFWPRGGFGLYWASRSEDVDGPGNTTVERSTTNSYFSLDLDPQLVIVPTEHFFFSVGPLVNIPLTGSRSVEQNNTEVSNDLSVFHIGLSASVGGWFGPLW